MTNQSPSSPARAGADRYQHLTQTNAGHACRRIASALPLAASGVDRFVASRFCAASRFASWAKTWCYFAMTRSVMSARLTGDAYRRTDLALGRIESGGIRCPLSRLAVLTDIGHVSIKPAEASVTAKDRIRMKSYPLHEAGGAFWAYSGPGEPPLFPELSGGFAGGASIAARRAWFRGLQLDAGERRQYRSCSHVLFASVGSLAYGGHGEPCWSVFPIRREPELAAEDIRFGEEAIYPAQIEGTDRSSIRITNFGDA